MLRSAVQGCACRGVVLRVSRQTWSADPSAECLWFERCQCSNVSSRQAYGLGVQLQSGVVLFCSGMSAGGLEVQRAALLLAICAPQHVN